MMFIGSVSDIPTLSKDIHAQERNYLAAKKALNTLVYYFDTYIDLDRAKGDIRSIIMEKNYDRNHFNMKKLWLSYPAGERKELEDYMISVHNEKKDSELAAYLEREFNKSDE